MPPPLIEPPPPRIIRPIGEPFDGIGGGYGGLESVGGLGGLGIGSEPFLLGPDGSPFTNGIYAPEMLLQRPFGLNQGL